MIDPMSIPVVGPILKKISDIIVAALFSHLNYLFCSKPLVEDLQSENENLEIVENLISRKADEGKIKPLTFAESWDMFSKTVGVAKIDSLQNISVAKDICKRCGGLPLVILAVGKALKYKPLESWKDARNQLKNSNIEQVSGIPKDVYACLKWSFDNLEDDAKACLLLASLFAEDANIPIRALVQLAKGSHLLVAGRTRVHSMIYILKSASLLLPGKDSEHIKLHDIIRDMARSIAIKDHGFLLATSGSLPNNPAEYSALKVMHIEVEKTHLGFPSNVTCPDLHTLSLRSDSGPRPELQEWVGQKFANLTFLVLDGISWPRELSLESLDNLKTLWLNGCSYTGFRKADKCFPKKLENLCIWDSPLPKHLNFQDLNRLRKLEIEGIFNFYMLPHTISSLSSLEELRLPSKISVASRVAVLQEISKLPRLTSLRICSNKSISSELAALFPSLSEFHMFVGQPEDHQINNVSSGSFTKSITLFKYRHVEGYRILMEKAEEVILSGTGFTGSSIGIRDSKEFIDLRHMHIEDCEIMEYLARISPHGEIQENLPQSTPFSNLIKLEIKRCSGLKYLFCNSVARCLVQLQELKIEECRVMEEVIRGGGTSVENIINLLKLRKLILNHLPRLVGFYKDTKDSTPSRQIQPLFDRNNHQMVAFPSLEELRIRYLENITDIWVDNHDNASSFSQLKSLSVIGCVKLENVILPAHTLPNSEGDFHRSNTAAVTGRASEGHARATVLKKQKHILLNMLKKTVRVPKFVSRRIPATREEHLDATSEVLVQVLPRITRVCPLEHMNLLDLPCLKNTGLNFRDHAGAVILFANLESLEISRCSSLENLFMPSLDRQVMTVTECDEIREINGAGEQGITNGIEFPKLGSLVLIDLPVSNFSVRCQSRETNSYKVGFPNLKTFKFRCEEITGSETLELGKDDFLEELTIVNNGKQIQMPDQWLLHLNNLENLNDHPRFAKPPKFQPRYKL